MNANYLLCDKSLKVWVKKNDTWNLFFNKKGWNPSDGVKKVKVFDSKLWLVLIK